MVSIVFQQDNAGNTIAYHSAGHVSDTVVCGMISALEINAINSIRQLTDCLVDVVINDGIGQTTFCLSNPEDVTVQLLMQSLYIGIQSIVKNTDEVTMAIV